jgi:hypothetical protein
MASTEDQAPREAVLDATGDAQSRTFAVGSGEGEVVVRRPGHHKGYQGADWRALHHRRGART